MRSLLRIAICLPAFLVPPALSQDTPAEPPAEPAQAAGAAQGKITLQLNKMEASDNACHAYIVVNNQSPEPLQELKVDVYLFDKQGVILQGIALQFTGVGSDKEMVVPFELPDVACEDVGRVLLNKLLTCTSAEGAPIPGCDELLAVGSLAPAPFEN
jgi:hypothetical protein